MGGKECGECKGGSSLTAMGSAMSSVMFLLLLLFALLFMKATKEDEENKKKKNKKGCCGGSRERLFKEVMHAEQGIAEEMFRQESALEKKMEEKVHHKKEKKDEKNLEKKKPKVKRVKRKQTQQEKLEGAHGSQAAGRLIDDQMLLGRESEASAGNDTFRNDTQVIMDRIKIFYGWLQIFTALTITFEIPWPIQLRTFSISMGFINFDVSNLLSESACSFAVPFLDTMTVHLAVPIMLLITIVLSRIPAHFLRKKHRAKQRGLMVKLIASLALILYPGLCTRLFSSLKTVVVYGLKSETHSGKVLAVDYAVEAFGSKHMPYVFLTIAGVVLYVIGVPLAVLLALRSNKKYLYTEGSTEEDLKQHESVVNAFGTLYLQCEFDPIFHLFYFLYSLAYIVTLFILFDRRTKILVLGSNSHC